MNSILPAPKMFISDFEIISETWMNFFEAFTNPDETKYLNKKQANPNRDQSNQNNYQMWDSSIWTRNKQQKLQSETKQKGMKWQKKLRQRKMEPERRFFCVRSWRRRNFLTFVLLIHMEIAKDVYGRCMRPSSLGVYIFPSRVFQ